MRLMTTGMPIALQPGDGAALSAAEIPNVLSIAGSDPSGGAGIQGDLKTFAAIGVFGCAVPTALTAQNTTGVLSVWAVPAEIVTRQLEVLLDDVPVAAVKIGMLADAGVVRAVADVLRRYRPPWIVLDPVLHAGVGGALLTPDGLEMILEELLPLVHLVTPNAMEAAALLGIEIPASVAEARHAAVSLVGRGAPAALVTGGHLADERDCVDVLAAGGAVLVSRVTRESGDAHGTGCALSAAIAANLARGMALAAACAEAQRFVAAAVRNRVHLHVGSGALPVHVLG